MTFSEDRTQLDPSGQHAQSISPPSPLRGSEQDTISQHDLLISDLPMAKSHDRSVGDESRRAVITNRPQIPRSFSDGDNASSTSGKLSWWVNDHGEEILAQAESLFVRDDQASAYVKIRTALATVVRARSDLEEDYIKLLEKFTELDRDVKSPKAIIRSLAVYIERLEHQISTLTDQNNDLNLHVQILTRSCQELTHVVDRQEDEIDRTDARLNFEEDLRASPREESSGTTQVPELKEMVRVLKRKLKTERDTKFVLEEQLREAEREIAEAASFQIDSRQDMYRLHLELIDLNNKRAVQPKGSAEGSRQSLPIAILEDSGVGVSQALEKTLHDELEETYLQYAIDADAFESPRPAPKPAPSPAQSLTDLQDRLRPSGTLSQGALVAEPVLPEEREPVEVECRPVSIERQSRNNTQTGDRSIEPLTGDCQVDVGFNLTSETHASSPNRQTQVDTDDDLAATTLISLFPSEGTGQISPGSLQDRFRENTVVDATLRSEPILDKSNPRNTIPTETLENHGYHPEPAVQKHNLVASLQIQAEMSRESEPEISAGVPNDGDRQQAIDVFPQNSNSLTQKHQLNEPTSETNSAQPSKRILAEDNVTTSPHDETQELNNTFSGSTTTTSIEPITQIPAKRYVPSLTSELLGEKPTVGPDKISAQPTSDSTTPSSIQVQSLTSSNSTLPITNDSSDNPISSDRLGSPIHMHRNVFDEPDNHVDDGALQPLPTALAVSEAIVELSTELTSNNVLDTDCRKSSPTNQVLRLSGAAYEPHDVQGRIPVAEHSVSELTLNTHGSHSSAGPVQYTASNRASKSRSASSRTSISPVLSVARQEDPKDHPPTSKSSGASEVAKSPRDAKQEADIARQVQRSTTPPRSTRYGLSTPPSSSRQIRKSSLPIRSSTHKMMTPPSSSQQLLRTSTATKGPGPNSIASSAEFVTYGLVSPVFSLPISRRSGSHQSSESSKFDLTTEDAPKHTSLDTLLHANGSREASSSPTRAAEQSDRRDQKSLSLHGQNSDQASIISPTPDLDNASDNAQIEDVRAGVGREVTQEDYWEPPRSGTTDTSSAVSTMSKKFESAIQAWFPSGRTPATNTNDSRRVKRGKLSSQRDRSPHDDESRSHTTVPLVADIDDTDPGNAISSRYDIQTTDAPGCRNELASVWSGSWLVEEPDSDRRDEEVETSECSEGQSSSVDISTHEQLRRRSLNTTSLAKVAQKPGANNASTAPATVESLRSSLRQEPSQISAVRHDAALGHDNTPYQDLLGLCVEWAKQTVIYIYATVATAQTVVRLCFRKSVKLGMTCQVRRMWPLVPCTGLTSNIAFWQWIHFTIALVFLCLTYQVYVIRQHWSNANASQVREVVMGWRESQWESNLLRFLRWHLEVGIERQLTYGQPLRLT